MNTLHHLRGIGTTQQQDRALDPIVPVIIAKDAVALLGGKLKLAAVAQKDRCAVALGHYDGAHVVESLHQTDAADDKAELAARDDAAAGAAAIGADGIGDVLQ